MPRRLRIHYPGAMYHVTLRGNHRQDIFFTPDDRVILEMLLAEMLERFLARLHAYCWMTNHVHMLLQVANEPLSRLMHQVAGRYAWITQRRLETTGHLFEKRYHAIVIDADEYLLTLLRYIHLNPVRAGMVGHPRDYRWSSHHAYAGGATPSWLTTDFALSCLHTHRNGAIDAYQRLIDNDLAHPLASPLLDCRDDSDVLGSDDFMRRIGREPPPRPIAQTLTQLVAEACTLFAVAEAALLSADSRRQLTHARAWIAHEAVTRRICSLTHVARHLGRSESALRLSVARNFP
jgi:putative transposase